MERSYRWKKVLVQHKSCNVQNNAFCNSYAVLVLNSLTWWRVCSTFSIWNFCCKFLNNDTYLENPYSCPVFIQHSLMLFFPTLQITLIFSFFLNNVIESEIMDCNQRNFFICKFFEVILLVCCILSLVLNFTFY